MSDNNNTTEQPPKREGTGIVAVAMSVMAAAFGVQSRKNRERDFQKGKPLHFIVGGLIGTLVFIVFVIVLVKLTLNATS